jgi:hypothetical protein
MRAGRGEEGKHFSLLHPALAHSSFTIRHYGESGPRRSSPRRVCCVGWSKRCVQSWLVSACGAARCLWLSRRLSAQLRFRAWRPAKAFSISSSEASRTSSSARPPGRRTSSPIRLASISSRRRRRAPWHRPPDRRFAYAAATVSIFRYPAAMRRRLRCARHFVRQAPQRSSSVRASIAPMRAMANATPSAKTPSPIARSCAPTAPATAAVREGWLRSTSLSTLRCVPAT